MTISKNRNIGIGIVAPIEKLDVAVKIRACEVILKQNNWCDYVFKENYKLPSIEEVEKFINEYNHLPYIPSEKEIISKDVDLLELITLQQNKIEELMLYIIELNQNINEINEK